jgi:hypothetical protein
VIGARPGSPAVNSRLDTVERLGRSSWRQSPTNRVRTKEGNRVTIPKPQPMEAPLAVCGSAQIHCAILRQIKSAGGGQRHSKSVHPDLGGLGDSPWGRHERSGPPPRKRRVPYISIGISIGLDVFELNRSRRCAINRPRSLAASASAIQWRRGASLCIGADVPKWQQSAKRETMLGWHWRRRTRQLTADATVERLPWNRSHLLPNFGEPWARSIPCCLFLPAFSVGNSDRLPTGRSLMPVMSA